MNATPRLSFSMRTEILGPVSLARPDVVVAVPVKDEEERIVACVASLANQIDVDLASVAVILLLNNCSDSTAERIRALGPELPLAVHLREVDLPAPYANAGWARRLAMEAAAELVNADGLILTTDADTQVECDWVAANQREIASGVDAVAGYVIADPYELMQLPPEILERGSLEWEYQQLAAELEARADPQGCDPWPRHNQNCGASAAITARAYRLIGGLPPRPVGEDRALFQSLRRVDGRIRHSLDVQVITSARIDGRALGGLSDAIRLRGEPDHPCDEMLEVAVVTLRRAVWRSQLRTLWRHSRETGLASTPWPARLGISERDFRRAAERRHFGEFWTELEALSPRLKRQLVTGAQLKRELRRMRRLVESARSRDRRPQPSPPSEPPAVVEAAATDVAAPPVVRANRRRTAAA
jgi:glycosyltransferase involved in cell wall biosynthesis